MLSVPSGVADPGAEEGRVVEVNEMVLDAAAYVLEYVDA